MTALRVRGGIPLSGRVTPSANKNAVLPVLCATLLTEAPVVLRNVPDITDARKIIDLFRVLGSRVDWDQAAGVLRVRHERLPYADAARQPAAMRAAVLLIPGLLHRLGTARLEDGVKGCTLGAREIDPHIEILESFGASVASTPGEIVFRQSGRFSGTRCWLDYASVTTTENFVLCAVVAAGRSELTNAACEPHVQELCAFLGLLGARIGGQGTSRLTIDGVDELGGADFSFAEDFHEIATFLAIGAITGGGVAVRNRRPDQFPLIDRTFAKFGVELRHADGWSAVAPGARLRVRQGFTPHMLTKVEAAPWPYLPADLLPIFIALGVRSAGQVMFWNKVYEGALTWHTELALFGAHTLLCDPHRLITFGGKALAPATVTSPYIIRVAIALLMIAASTRGESMILDADPIRRAHPRFVENLASLGADADWLAADGGARPPTPA
jgi:UDP-N-acetylglucosamine 1-carboxyvinyltransferase